MFQKMSLAFEILQKSVLHEAFIVGSDDYWILRYNNEKVVMWFKLKQKTWLVRLIMLARILSNVQKVV